MPSVQKVSYLCKTHMDFDEPNISPVSLDKILNDS